MLPTVQSCARRLTLGLRLSRTGQAMKARCAALLHAPMLWYATALQVIFRPGSSGSGLHGTCSAEGACLLPGGGLSSASVAAQCGSGSVHDLAEAEEDATASTAESMPVAAAPGAPVYDSAVVWDGAGHVKFE